MELSKHNIFRKIHDSNNYLLVNLLHGQADILDPATTEEYMTGRFTDKDTFIEKRYLIDPQKEQSIFRARYIDFLDRRDSDEIQIFFVPWYSCNFNCSYCYQESYSPVDGSVKPQVVRAFFETVKTRFSGRKKYITLFGGEPLLQGKRARDFLDLFFSLAGEYDIDVALVTNGYHLEDYIDLLSKSTIREVQVTLDGPLEIHDMRRPLKSGEGTFDRISRGIDLLIEKGIAVNLRVVLDRENMDHLPQLAAHAVNRGWTRAPGFKTQLGRNYELHSCQTGADKLFTRAGLYEAVYDLIQKHPHILKFHKPAFSVSRFLLDSGELPEPLFDSCPACKTEWAFDYSGTIYPCTATVGKVGDEVGTFYPEYSLDDKKIETWEDRDITSIAKCRTCELSLACGGGCGAVALNREGNVNAPDCNPVGRLLELGISHYFEKDTRHV